MDRSVRILLLAVCLLAAWPVMALDPSMTLAQYRHTSWAGKDGAPTDIVGMTQTPDGLLWLGTSAGLMRFDGVTFEKVTSLGGYEFGSESVGYLTTDAEGWLWIGFNGGVGCGRYRQGVFKAIRKCNVYPYAAFDEGTTWMIVNEHLSRVKGDEIEVIGEKWGYPATASDSVIMDSRGTIWAMPDGIEVLYYLPKGAKTFRRFEPRFGTDAIQADREGNIWMAGGNGLSVIKTTDGLPTEDIRVSDTPMSEVAFDRDGALWGGTERGIFHVAHPKELLAPNGAALIRKEVVGQEQGLSSNNVAIRFEDRQGNMWIGTAAGLERYSDSRFVRVRLPGREFSPSMAAAENGEVYATTGDGSLQKVGRTGVTELTQVGPAIRCLIRDREGIVWGASSKTVWKIGPGGAISAVSVPADNVGGYVRAMAKDASGAIWTVGGTAASSLRYADGLWSVPGDKEGFPNGWYGFTAATDHLGRLWFSSGEDVLLVDRGKVRRLSKELGLEVATITSFYERGEHMWVGGGYGVAFFDGSRFHSLKAAGEWDFREISGIVETADGTLWLHGPTDAFRIAQAEVARAVKDPEHRVAVEHFDARDGLLGSAAAFNPRPTLIEGTDGRLWFASSAGLFWINPAAPEPRLEPPVPMISSISFDGSKQEAVGHAVAAERTSTVRLDYTAITPSVPERLKFRYRLDGVDDDWQDVGARRAAYYGRLAPGPYKFHVMASNGDGRWNATDTTFDFEVRPAWFQTWLFRSACVALGLLALWMVYGIRVRQLTAKVRWQLRIQQAERERIARDLHDTLLQGIHGLIWSFQSVANHVSPDSPVRRRMETALETADQILVQGRDRVHDLRAASEEGKGLSVQVADIAGAVAREHQAEVCIKVEGRERECRPGVTGQVCDIAREYQTK